MAYTNTELLKFLDLPDTIITGLQTKESATYTAARNQFLNALVNKIAYQKVDAPQASNPFDKYWGFPINYGDTIENVFVPLKQGKKFNSDATNPFAKDKPEVIPLYGQINYDMQYKVTIEDALLRRAAFNEYGFMQLIEQILGNQPKARALDHYWATLTMLNNPDIFANGIEEIVDEGDAKVNAENITKKIIDVVSSFQLPVNTNNKLQQYNPTELSKCLLIIKQDVLNSINLDYLAGVYNLSKVDLIKNIIPVASFQTLNESGETIGDDITFMVIDTDGLDMHKALEDGGELYNPEGKYTNHYLNSWAVFGFKYYYNARAFQLQ